MVPARRARDRHDAGPIRGPRHPADIPASGDARDQAIATTRAQLAQLETACRTAGRDPATVRRSLLAYRVQLFESVDVFEGYVGRYAELGFDECIFYWPADPSTFTPRPDLERTLERVAADVLPRLRSGRATI